MNVKGPKKKPKATELTRATVRSSIQYIISSAVARSTAHMTAPRLPLLLSQPRIRKYRPIINQAHQISRRVRPRLDIAHTSARMASERGRPRPAGGPPHLGHHPAAAGPQEVIRYHPSQSPSRITARAIHGPTGLMAYIPIPPALPRRTRCWFIKLEPVEPPAVPTRYSSITTPKATAASVGFVLICSSWTCNRVLSGHRVLQTVVELGSLGFLYIQF